MPIPATPTLLTLVMLGAPRSAIEDELDSMAERLAPPSPDPGGFLGIVWRSVAGLRDRQRDRELGELAACLNGLCSPHGEIWGVELARRLGPELDFANQERALWAASRLGCADLALAIGAILPLESRASVLAQASIWAGAAGKQSACERIAAAAGAWRERSELEAANSGAPARPAPRARL